MQNYLFKPLQRPVLIDYHSTHAFLTLPISLKIIIRHSDPIRNLKFASPSELLSFVRNSNTRFASIVPEQMRTTVAQKMDRLGIDNNKIVKQGIHFLHYLLVQSTPALSCQLNNNPTVEQYCRQLKAPSGEVRQGARRVQQKAVVKLADLDNVLNKKLNNKLLMFQASLFSKDVTEFSTRSRQAIRNRKPPAAEVSVVQSRTEQQSYHDIFIQLAHFNYSDTRMQPQKLRELLVNLNRVFPDNQLWSILKTQLFTRGSGNMRGQTSESRVREIMDNTIRLLEDKYNTVNVPYIASQLNTYKIQEMFELGGNLSQEEEHWYRKFVLFRAGRFDDIRDLYPNEMFTEHMQHYLSEPGEKRSFNAAPRYDINQISHYERDTRIWPAKQQLYNILNRKSVVDSNFVRSLQDFIWLALKTCQTDPSKIDSCDFHLFELQDYVKQVFESSAERNPVVLALGLQFHTMLTGVKPYERLIVELLINSSKIIPKTLNSDLRTVPASKINRKVLMQEQRLVCTFEEYTRKVKSLEQIVATILLLPKPKQKLRCLARVLVHNNLITEFFSFGLPSKQNASKYKQWILGNSYIQDTLEEEARDNEDAESLSSHSTISAQTNPDKNASYPYLVKQIAIICREENKYSEALERVEREVLVDQESANQTMLRVVLNSLKEEVSKKALESALTKLRKIQNSQKIDIILDFAVLYKQLFPLMLVETPQYSQASECTKHRLYPFKSNSYREEDKQLDRKLWSALAEEQSLPVYLKFLQCALVCEKALELYEKGRPPAKQIAWKKLEELWSIYMGYGIEWDQQTVSELQNYLSTSL